MDDATKDRQRTFESILREYLFKLDKATDVYIVNSDNTEGFDKGIYAFHGMASSIYGMKIDVRGRERLYSDLGHHHFSLIKFAILRGRFLTGVGLFYGSDFWNREDQSRKSFDGRLMKQSMREFEYALRNRAIGFSMAHDFDWMFWRFLESKTLSPAERKECLTIVRSIFKLFKEHNTDTTLNDVDMGWLFANLSEKLKRFESSLPKNVYRELLQAIE